MATTTAELPSKPPRAFANPHLINGGSKKNPIKMTGYLEKRSKMVGWKKFWFVLDGRLLTYYKSCADYNSQLSACSGSINVGIASVVRPLQLKGYKGFALQITTRTQIYFLRSPEKKQLEKWLLAIQELVTSPRAEDRWADASDGEFSHVNYNNNSPYSTALPLNKRNATNLSQWTLNNYCMSTEDLTSSKINGLPVSSNYTNQPTSTLKKFHSLISLNSPHQNQTSGFLRSHNKKPINTNNTVMSTTIPRSADVNHHQIEEFKKELKRRVSDREKFTPEFSTSTESPEEEDAEDPGPGQESIDMTPDLIKGTLPKNADNKEILKIPSSGDQCQGQGQGKKAFRPSQFDEFIDFERDVYEPCEITKSDQVENENIYEIVDDNIATSNENQNQILNDKPSEWKDFPIIGKEPLQMYKRLAQGTEKPARPPAPNFDHQQQQKQQDVDEQQNHVKSKTPEYTILKPLNEPSPSPPPAVKSVRTSPRIPQRVESLDDSPANRIVMKKVSPNNQDTLSISSNDSGKNKIVGKDKDKDKKWFGGRIFSKIFQKDKDKSAPNTSGQGQGSAGGGKRGSQIVISAPVDLRNAKLKAKNQDVLMDELRERVVQLNRMNSSESSEPSAPRTSIDDSILFQKVSHGKNVLKKSLTLPDSESPPSPSEDPKDLDLSDKEILVETPAEIVEKPIDSKNLVLDLDVKNDKFQEKLARFNRISSQLSPSFNQVLNPHDEGSYPTGSFGRKYNSFKYPQRKTRIIDDPPVLPPKKKNLTNSGLEKQAPDYDVPQNNSPIPPPVPAVGPPSSDDEEMPKSFPRKKYSAPAMNFDTLYELQAFAGSSSSDANSLRKSPEIKSEFLKPESEMKLKYSIEEVEELDEQLIYENFENVYCNCSELLALGEGDHDEDGDKRFEYANVQVEKGITEEIDGFYESVESLGKVEVKNQVQEDIYNSPEVLQALQILEEAIESLEIDYPSCDCSKIDGNHSEFMDLPPPPPPPPEEFIEDHAIIDEFPSPPTPEELDEIIESHTCSPPSSPAGENGQNIDIDSKDRKISTDNQLIGNLKIDLKSGQTTFSTETETEAPLPPPPPPPPKEEFQSPTPIEKPQNQLEVKYATVNTIIQETETVQETQDLEELTELYDDFPYDFLPIPSPTPPGEEPQSATGDEKTSRSSLRHSGIDQLELFLQKHVTNQKGNFGPPVINRLGHSSAVNQLQKIVINNQESPKALQKSYI